ncbi:MAG: polyprenyl synthetase family protein, partial [Bacteroidota bacterium]
MQQAAALKQDIENHIKGLNLFELSPHNLYAPMGYILSLKGKRIRPILTLLAYQGVSGQVPHQAMNLAVSLELFHNFTLMHDDIMDRAPMRRGQPAVHIKWDENIAILSGDALFAFSMGLVVEGFPQHAAALAKEYARVAMGVCEGQMEDLDMAQQEQVSIEEYIEMIRKKTAVLLGGCLSLGALAAGASAELADEMRRYGEMLGIAFQLQDDLMDAFPPENFGKQVGGDIIENKKTYLFLKALELA